MARASGWNLPIPKEGRNPRYATTYGTGELIQRALEQEVREIYITLGGSVTNDGGVGAALALGFDFLDSQGNSLFANTWDVFALKKLEKIVQPPLPKGISFFAVVDVENPLLGKQGATYVYGRQKGAKPEDLPHLEESLKRLYQVVKKQWGKDINFPGAGAAGGFGAGLYAFLDAKILKGAAWVAEKIRLSQAVAQADLILTGEGKLDEQTAYGKAISHLIALAREKQKPLWILAGSLGKGWEKVLEKGVSVIDTSGGTPPKSREEARKNLIEGVKKACQKWKN